MKIIYIDNVETCPIIIDNYRYIYSDNSYRNHSLLCGTLGSEYSSSNINYDVKKFYQKIGTFISGSHYYLTSDSTDFSKKILSVKYDKKSPKRLLKFDNPLSIGYMVNSNLDLTIENTFEYQNRLASSMIGESVKIFRELKPINVTLNNNKKCFNYDGYADNYGIKKIINKEKILNIDIKKFEIRSKHDLNRYFNLNNNWLYYEDEGVVDYVISKLSEKQLKITKMEKNILEGNIDVDDNKILFLSIPYEDGWNIYVDGKRVDYFKIYDAFIGIKLNEGHHEIKMKFYPKGLNIGIIISISTLISIFIYNIFKINSKKIKIHC